jgi:hypothetical protein
LTSADRNVNDSRVLGTYVGAEDRTVCTARSFLEPYSGRGSLQHSYMRSQNFKTIRFLLESQEGMNTEEAFVQRGC